MNKRPSTTRPGWAAIAAAAVSVLVVTGCTPSASHNEAKPKSKSDVITVAMPSDINSFDPANTLGGEDQEIVLNLYDKLVDFVYKESNDGALVWQGLEVQPSLAKSWDIDGAKITFHLRDDVTFSSGNKLTAEDVQWSFARLTEIAGNGRNQASVAGLRKADQIDVIDPLTLSITFTDPTGAPAELPVSLPNMRFLQFGIIDSATAKLHATATDPWASEWLAKNVAGTGPYTVASRVAGQQITLEAVTPRWTGQEVGFPKVVLRVTGDADPVGLMKSGVIDFVSKGVSPRQFDDLASSGFGVYNEQVPVILKAEMTTDLGVTADESVRQAIAYAIPYDQIIDSVFSSRGERAKTLMNPQDPFANDAWAKYDTDLPKARKLLAKAGVENPTIKLWYNADFAALEDTALLIKQSLAEIGVTIDPQPRPGVQFKSLRAERTQGANNDMIGIVLDGLNGSIWVDDPDTTVQNWGATGGGQNWARYSNPEVDQLHSEYRYSSDRQGRLGAYHKIQDLMAESAHVIPVAVVGQTLAVAPGISGVAFGPDSYMRLSQLRPAS